MEALDEPYLQIQLMQMIRKRGGWLSALFIGEMLTATAMGYFEAEIARAVIFALFVPLIICSGGNSGSQATTLVIRAMALGEIRLRDWWRVIVAKWSGLGLGSILGYLGLIRIFLAGAVPRLRRSCLFDGADRGLSLLGVVLWGTMAGSMLPFILRGLDSIRRAPLRPSSRRWSTSPDW